MLRVQNSHLAPADYEGCLYSENMQGKIWIKKRSNSRTLPQWHREFGPAVEKDDGTIEWYLDGCVLSYEDYWKEMYRRYPDNELVLSHLLGAKQ